MKFAVCVALLFIAQAMGSAILPKAAPAHPIGDWTKLWQQPGNGILRKDDRIINGVEAEPHSLPFVTALFMAGGSFCTSSLISNQWVLTAAHCQERAVVVYTDVYIGAHNVRQPEADRLEIRATEKYIHPDWNSNSLRGDIALIMLPSPISLTANIQPIRLAPLDDTNLYVGERVRLAGWGITADGATAISPVLRTTEVDVITNAECRNTYGVIIQDWTICTSFTSTNSGTCSGDSGSSLSIQKPDGSYEQIGVTSFVSSAGCSSGNPDGFTRLSAYRQWVQDTSGI